MSAAYIPAELRRRVTLRARRFCEYCLIHEDDTNFGCEADHIISLKHGGETSEDNLALACLVCNRAKGSDIGSLVHDRFTRFYNPRTDAWFDHFEVEPSGRIAALSDIGAATIRIFGFNLPERVEERALLMTSTDTLSAAPCCESENEQGTEAMGTLSMASVPSVPSARSPQFRGWRSGCWPGRSRSGSTAGRPSPRRAWWW